MEVATDTRKLFELLEPIETDLDGFNVTLVVGGRATVLKRTKTCELSTIFSQRVSTNFGYVIIRPALIATSTLNLCTSI
jgi:hypothetical protein